jgi:CheY-like chemotaxis protein
MMSMTTTTEQRRGKVMVVDDDRIVLEIARERLESAGFEVITRDVALGTSAAIQKEQPDIILLDVQMPGLTGTALAKLIMGRDTEALIVLHSGSEGEALRKMAEECGAVGVIKKTHDDAAFLSQFDRFTALSKRIKRR